MISRIKFIQTLTLIAFFINGIAQTIKSPVLIPPSPEVAALFKFSEIPVSLATGTPEISVPIYTITTAQLQYPISLSYHASSIRVNEIASNVGLNWVLNSGGMIFRNMKGAYNRQYANENHMIYFNNGYDVCSNFDEAKKTQLEGILYGAFSSEPDEFSISEQFFSGKFYPKANGSYVTQPLSGIKIIRIYKPGNHYGGFQVIDQKGVSYYYDAEHETQTSNGYRNVTGFSLSKILSADKKDSIVFEYDTYSQKEVSVNVSYSRRTSTVGGAGSCVSSVSIPFNWVSSNSYDEKNFDGRTIKKISFNNGYLEFIKSSRPDAKQNIKKFDKILLYAKNYTTNTYEKIKGWSFNYGLFSEAGSSTPIFLNTPTSLGEPDVCENLRLKLNAVNNLDNTENIINKYEFQYDESVSLPKRSSASQDLWGFYNGKQNTDLVRRRSEYGLFNSPPELVGGADRSPDYYFAKAWLINKITYPTGGISNFSFEPNYKMVGETINSYEGPNTTAFSQSNQLGVTTTTNQQVTATVNSSDAILEINFVIPTSGPTYGYELRGQLIDRTTNQVIKDQFLTVSPSTPTGGQTFKYLLSIQQGHVYEAIASAQGMNHRTAVKARWISGSTVVTSKKDFASVRIGSIKHFDANGKFASGELYKYGVNEDDIATPLTPVNFLEDDKTTQQMFTRCGTCCIGISTCPIPQSAFYTTETISSSPLYEIGYLGGSPAVYTEVTKYKIDENNNPLYKTNYKFDIQRLGVERRFGGVGFNRNNVYINNSWRGADLLETLNYKKEGNGYIPVRKTANTYNYLRDESVINGFKFYRSYTPLDPFTDIKCAVDCLDYGVAEYPNKTEFKVLASSEVTNYHNSIPTTLIQKTNNYYNSSTNFLPIRTETINSEGEQLKVEYKYPHDFAGTEVYDAMIASNIISPEIEQKSFSNSTLLSRQKTNYNLWNIEKFALPHTVQTAQYFNAFETELNYDSYDNKSNPLQYTAKDGVPTSFIWGYNQQYPLAKIVGKTYADALSQSGINLTVLNNPANEITLRQELDKLKMLSGSFVTTYTYKQLVGITSETDPNRKTKYYEYDAFNRLILIRDQDNNILKKICYNYAGQPENCN
jgi:YD repeat-containing protein